MMMRTEFSIPEPFAWVDIPAGQVILADDKGSFDVTAFKIAKYPVTVEHYTLFIEDGGYQKSEYWTTSGWDYCQKEGITLPLHWDFPAWQSLRKPQHPVVNISWLEAYAFCNWLSEKINLKISLPTEQQWQRAAEGEEKLTYPWGNEWDEARCNHSLGENWKARYSAGEITTKVTQFEDVGASSFGVVDMVGNVWEWCLTEYETATNGDLEDIDQGRIIRGGAWGVENIDWFRVNFRHLFYPHYRFSNVGFRVVYLED